MAANPTPPPDLLTASNPGFAVQTRKPIVTFNTRDVDPPTIVYVTIDDVLVVDLWAPASSPAVQLAWRVLRADGTIIRETQQVLVQAAFTRQRFTYQLPEGFLLSFTAEPVNWLPLRGQVWLRASIGKANGAGFDLYQPLVSDYLTESSAPTWPGGRLESSVEGPGFLTSVNIANPVAGHSFVVAPSPNLRFRVRWFSFQLVASATVANRTVFVQWTPSGTAEQFFAVSGVVQTAGQALLYNAAPVNIQSAPNTIVGSYIPLIDPTLLTTNELLTVSAVGLQAGDQFQNISLALEQWVEASNFA